MKLGRHVFPISRGVTRLGKVVEVSLDAGEGHPTSGRGSELEFLVSDHPLPQPHPWRLVCAVERIQLHGETLMCVVAAMIN